ncbi:Rne/Rng family ribonuclease [Synechococcus sp. PCC 7336]|uniref:Rne/Rng family ribonuclease n=1 Tax=Synechococcus sp. PCC 7336 TaxID=195250 RepID=UPI00034C3060|nr:Rne/Rng family ribonuclease [Synechococcus sp. PCC 7336]
MSKQIIIGEQHRIAAVFSEDRIQELIVASGHHQVGDVYLGIVENVLPSIDAAFINIGNPERNGFIHVSDLGPIRLKRSSSAITELVTPQQKVLVQVMKEPTGNKGPRLTGNLSFPGRYLVLMPSGRGVNLSSRIRDEEERNRLKSLAILIKPPQMGLMVRTEADGMPEESIIEDLEILKKQWEAIQQEQHATRPPSLLNRDNDFIQRVLRDAFSDEVNRIVTDTPEGVQRVRKHLQNWNKGRMPAGVAIDAHRESTPVFDYYRVNAAIRQALRPRVDLPSGGYIIIEPTEALTVIDVNSGSFTRSATSRETVLWTNCEAATEIAHQMRLRNIAGVIVVDFIDMDSRRDQLQVLEHFNKTLRADKSRPQIAQLSELGLVELTRKRQGQSLYEVFGRPCPTCEGLGLLAHLPGAHPELEQTPFDHSVTNASAVLASSVPDAPAATAGTRVGGDRNGGSRRRSTYSNGGRSATPVPENLYQGGRRGRRSPAAPTRSETPTPTPTPAPTKVIEPPQKSTVEEGADPASSPPAPTPRKARRKLINIEMTPPQQKVYSEMGISPLALLEEPVKTGRDTVVAVSLPGQAPLEIDGFDLDDEVEDRTEAIDLEAGEEVELNPSDEDLSDGDTDPTEEHGSTADRADFPDRGSAGASIESAEPSEASGTEPDSDSSESSLAAEVKPKKQSPAASRRKRSRSSD